MHFPLLSFPSPPPACDYKGSQRKEPKLPLQQARGAHLPDWLLSQLRCISAVSSVLWTSRPVRFLPWVSRCISYAYIHPSVGRCVCIYRVTLLPALILTKKRTGSPLPTALCRKSLRLNDDAGLLLKLILYTAFLWQFDDRSTSNDPGIQFKAALNGHWHWAAHLGFGSRAKLSCYGSETIHVDPLLLTYGQHSAVAHQLLALESFPPKERCLSVLWAFEKCLSADSCR